MHEKYLGDEVTDRSNLALSSCHSQESQTSKYKTQTYLSAFSNLKLQNMTHTHTHTQNKKKNVPGKKNCSGKIVELNELNE